MQAPSLKMRSVFALVLCCLAVGARAQKWVAVLDAANQVPPLTEEDVEGSTATFSLSFDGEVAEWTLDVTEVVNMTMAHIHIGNASTNGNPAVILVPVDGTMTAEGLPQLVDPESGSLTFGGNFTIADFITTAEGWTWDEFVALADTENLYVNIHTTEYPAGSIRGQIMSADDVDEEPVEEEPVEEEPADTGSEYSTAPTPAPVATSAALAPVGKVAATLAAALLAAALL